MPDLDDPDARDLARIYVITGGRVGPSGRTRIDLVTLVVAAAAEDAGHGPEQRAILRMCRTPLSAAQHLEKHVRGATAGFNTPSFVLDAPGGGGKRDVHSPERYDRETGISVFTSPSVKPGKQFLYFDPLSSLSEAQRERWAIPTERRAMIDAALA